MYILGINAYHAGASACLVHDGKLVAAVEEERFRRVKYWAGFPSQAIQYCLEKAGISACDLDHIGTSRDPRANLSQKVLFTLLRRPSFHLLKQRLKNLGEIRDVKRALCQALGVEPGALRAEFHHVQHHKAHLASAFFVSPFREAALLSLDGFGDFVSTMSGRGSENRLEVLDTINYPHSLGIFYTAVTQWLGFPRFGDEGKVQGLAPYGRPVYFDDFHKVVRLRQAGRFELDLDYFIHWADGVDMQWQDAGPVLGTIYSPKFVDKFGPPRRPGSEITPHHASVAASLQAFLEGAEFHILRRLHDITKLNSLCLAGGVALNSSANGKIRTQTPFENVFIQPAASDAGTALGVAYYIYHQLLGHPRCFVMNHAYTGPRFINGTVESVLRRQNLAYETHDEEDMARLAARLVADGKIVGWFQGDMEWGPRALGNRSILADARREGMKGILNARIKHRETFRPFAPSVLLESAAEYFHPPCADPFMLKVANVLKVARADIPAVTHVDGTARLQTVEKKQNLLYWQLLREFQGITGVPVVLNTSFNENEPIVCRPKEAVECFLRTRLDALAIGNYLVQKDS